VPVVIIIAGPNGAGKTTFANEYLSIEEKGFEFVNADEIVRAGKTAISEIEAGRRMLERIDELVERDADFVFETTLASLTYARKIPRVLAGGHNIPREAIMRRFDKSLTYFETKYKPIVDAWYLWDSREGSFALLESRERQ